MELGLSSFAELNLPHPRAIWAIEPLGTEVAPVVRPELARRAADAA